MVYTFGVYRLIKKYSKWLFPLLLVGGLAPLTPFLDMEIARFFYDGAHFVDNGWTRFLYRYGEIFGFICGGFACAIYLLSWGVASLKKWRKGALCLGLTLILGAGITVNMVLKEYWGRPRPKQVEEFGGKSLFLPFYKPHLQQKEDPHKSFPSGHATMGFYYFSLCLVGRRYGSRALFVLGLTLTIGLGVGLSLTRIAQGGHFFSDTVIAALVMWLTALFVDWLVFHTPYLDFREEQDTR